MNNPTTPTPFPGAALARNRNTRQKAEEYHQAQLKTIEDKYQPLIETAEQESETAEGNYELLRADLERFPKFWHEPFSWLYWFFLAALAVLEIPVNRLSFQLFFAENALTSLAVAGGVGVTLIVLAHFTGMVMVRFRHDCGQTGGVWAALGRLAVLIALIWSLCYGIAVFRQGYLAFATQPDPSFSALIANNQLGEAAVIALKIALGVEGWVFLFINLAIVGIGVFFAFSRHDPHPNFEEMHDERVAASRAVANLKKVHGEKVAAETRRFAFEIKRNKW
ncbi:MAG: hypothetical protein JNJ73_04840 [Hyphomonadaceae bacterium]|nr:hypothetical protein [Hyphomonadaceae bacterium]